MSQSNHGMRHRELSGRGPTGLAFAKGTIKLDNDKTELRDTPLLAEELGLLIDGATNYAIYMLDPHGVVTIWNRGAERIKGWRAGEIVGQHFALFYPPDDVAAGKPQADLDRASAEGRVEEDSWRIRKDGSEFLASVTITALHDSAGALRGFGKVVRDITDQKAAESALARREQHLRSILETVPDAMIVIDERGTISSFSAAAERLFGYAQTQAIGRNVKMLMPEPDRRQHDDYLEHYRTTGERKVIGKLRVVNGQRRTGETFPVELTVGETLSGGQRLFTAFLRDLTERRLTELRMQELQSELIHVSRLSAMGTMASTLAHELNQPLTAITNYLETTRDMRSCPTPRRSISFAAPWTRRRDRRSAPAKSCAGCVSSSHTVSSSSDPNRSVPSSAKPPGLG